MEGSGTADEGAVPAEPKHVRSLRDVRYCELLLSVVDGDRVSSYIYNTTGLNDCPAPLWDQLTEQEINEAFGSTSAFLNGPRHWTMDHIATSGESATGKRFTFGGIEMALGASFTWDVGHPAAGGRPYSAMEIHRDTVWTFLAGRPVFTLTDPDGHLYVMQSYAQLKDRTLTYEQLPSLGTRLELPEGWSYGSRVLDDDLLLDSGGLAHIVQDDLSNTYQRWDR